MAYQWLSIDSSFALPDAANPRGGASLVDWQNWSTSFIAEVRIESDPVRVDAIPFLYELLNASREFAIEGALHAHIGEGIMLHGAPEGDGIAVRIAFEAGGRNDLILRRRLSISNASMFLSLKIAELALSLERIDVDLEESLSNFPISHIRPLS